MFITTLWIAFRLEKDYLTKLTHALGEKIKNDSILDRLRAIIWNGRAGNCSQNNHKPKPEKHGIAHSNNKHGMKRKVKFWCFSRRVISHISNLWLYLWTSLPPLSTICFPFMRLQTKVESISKELDNFHLHLSYT